MPDPTSYARDRRHLAVTRKALGLTHAEMDRVMGSTYTDTTHPHPPCARAMPHLWHYP